MSFGALNKMWRETLLTVEALGLFVILDLMMKRWSLEEIYERLMLPSIGRSPAVAEGSADELVGRVVGVVTRATRVYYRRREDCLPRSLTLCRLLRRSGVPADLCIGVKRYPFQAHAWVEWNGQPIDESSLRVAAYKVLTRLEAPRPS